MSAGALPAAAGLEEAWRPRVNPWIITTTVMLTTFMEVLDGTIANVALPHIAANLSAGVDESTWVLTSYLVSNAIVLPMSGWLSSIFGRKRFYMGCVMIFTATSLACGFAPNLAWLVVLRIIQGAGGGGLQPTSQAILVESFPRAKQGMAMAAYGIGVVVAPVIGPTLGGWITDNYTWRWIFFINIPVGLLSLFLTSILVEDPPYLLRRSLRTMRIDYIGLGLLAVGLGFLQYMLDKGQREDWFESNLIVAAAAIAGTALLGIVLWELVARDPIVDFRLLKDSNFLLSNILMFALGFVLYSSTALIPIFLQTLMGYTATWSGLALSPGGLVTWVMLPVAGILLPRVGPRWLIAVGLLSGAMSLFYMSGFNLQIDFGTAAYARMYQAFGLAFLFVPINAAAFAYIPRSKLSNATGIINLARNIGGSAGIAFVTTLLTRRSQFHQNALVGHLTPYDSNYLALLDGAGQQLVQQGSDAAQAAQQAQGVAYGLVQQQAGMLAFIDNFWILGVVFLALIPLALLLKSPKPGHEMAMAE
ncbi:MAG: DHA2 family efflux MFS transporter permease subunit [Planctomycetota bacterium]|nr:DHA2 family efflux MFS transporter permease subunit [Planctomycetota bacterium]